MGLDEALGDLLAAARVAREGVRGCGSKRARGRLFVRKADSRTPCLAAWPALGEPGNFPLDGASADGQARIQQGLANGFGRMAVEVQPGDFGLEFKRLATESAGWLSGCQTHIRAPISRWRS